MTIDETHHYLRNQENWASNGLSTRAGRFMEAISRDLLATVAAQIAKTTLSTMALSAMPSRGKLGGGAAGGLPSEGSTVSARLLTYLRSCETFFVVLQLAVRHGALARMLP